MFVIPDHIFLTGQQMLFFILYISGGKNMTRMCVRARVFVHVAINVQLTL